MNGYNFTEDVRRVLATAREEAARLQHEYVGTEHILLGYTTPTQSAPAKLLQKAGVRPDEIRATIDRTVKRGKQSDSRPDLPYTSRAKKILELAMTEARDLGHDYVGIEHLLLGIIREEKGIAAQVLASHGVRADAVRSQVSGQGPPREGRDADWPREIKVVGVPPGEFVRTEVRRGGGRLQMHPGAVLALSVLWAALWVYLQPDVLNWRLLGVVLLIVAPPILLWRFTRR